MGVIQIDAGRLQCRFGLFQSGIRIIEVLLADRFVNQCFFEAVSP